MYILDVYLTGVFTPLQRDLFHKINSYKVRKLNKFVKSQMFPTVSVVRGKLVLI